MNLPKADHYMIVKRKGSGYECYSIVSAAEVENVAQIATGGGEDIVYIAPCYEFRGKSRTGASCTCTKINIR